MSRLIVSSIETQNIKFDSDTTAFTIGSDGGIKAEGTNTTSLQNGLAKVWCAYRGNGEALNDSLNVSGLTDHANGDDTHSFTNNMAHTNYCYSGSVLCEYVILRDQMAL